jgi:methionine-rich copper-binding protein CopC
MTCRWVTESRLATFGRRVIITSAVFGLTTVGGTGPAFAASLEIGHSPANPVVSRVPTAVSVTFREPLRRGGAQMRVLSAGAEIGVGEVTTAAKTLRRELRAGAPGGPYLVEWTAVSAKGKKMSGRFRFTAARGAEVVGAPTPAPSVTSTPAVVEPGRPTPTLPTPTFSVTSTPAVVETGRPTQTGTPSWITGERPVWTSQPTASVAAVSVGSSGDDDSSVSTGFTAIPLAMGALLVLAAGMVSLVHRPRLRG